MMRHLSFVVLLFLAASGSGCRHSGAAELEMAKALGDFRADWNESVRSTLKIPASVKTRLEAREWLLEEAIRSGSTEVQSSARYLLASSIFSVDCGRAESLLRENQNNPTSRRMLEDLESKGCQRYLDESITHTEESMRQVQLTANEISLEILQRSRAQLQRIKTQGQRE